MAKIKRKTKQRGFVSQHVDPQPVKVANPDYAPQHDGAAGNPQNITAMQNSKESAIVTLAQRGLLDKPQMQAATRFCRLWEAMGGKGAGSIDYLKEPVDGGGARDAIGDMQIDAGRQLADVQELLGAYGYRLVSYVCGQGYSIHELTATRRQRDTMTDMLRLHLDQLAEKWGYGKPAQRSGYVPLYMCTS